MRRIFVLLFTILASSPPIFAHPQKAFNEIPGEYVIYRDNRFNSLAYIGLCYLGNQMIAVRSFEPKTGAELVAIFSLTAKNGSIQFPSHINILRGSMVESTDTARLIPMIVNWANAWWLSKHRFAKVESYKYSGDDDYLFKKWIPVLHIAAVDPGSKVSAKAITAGILTSMNDPRFFDFRGLPSTVPGPSAKIPAVKSQEQTIDGFSVPLSSNWRQVNHNAHDSFYVLSLKTPRDAALIFENYSYEQLGVADLYSLMERMMLANRNYLLLLDGTKEYRDGKMPVLQTRLMDLSTRRVSVTFSLFRDQSHKKILAATLSAYESIYLQNKKYFDHLLFSSFDH